MNLSRPTLFAPAATVRAVAQARAVVVLVGSYDGSGNYGDIAQFAAALELTERLGPGVLALPVLEREYLADHRLLEQLGVAAPNALFFDPSDGCEDELQPVAAPVELASGAVYLYGGGYLNRNWGARKLAMLDASEALLAAGGVAAPARVASGLQVEPDWVAAGADTRLGRFDLLGARDAASRVALAEPGPAPAIATGDDAIGLLGCLPVGSGGGSPDALRLNLHFAEHGWVSERPGAMLDFYAGLVPELGRLAGRPVVAQPLIAYLDSRVDERPGIERLRAALAAAGVELAEPIVLRPAGLAEAAPCLRQASLTLSCSYHVALTSLMLEVPAFLTGDNPYYEQKAAGLSLDFGLPPALTASAGTDPAAVAAALVTVLLDPDRNREMRAGLTAGAAGLRQRRHEFEVRLLSQLGGAAAAALAARLEEQSERLRQRSTEPAELSRRLTTQQTELEELREACAEPRLESELRLQAAQADADGAQAALATILQSRSWRLLSPFRRLRARLRRH